MGADTHRLPAPPAGQRWRRRRPRWVAPERGVIDPTRYRVERICQTDAKPFVVEHHYTGRFPAARFAYGLLDMHADDELVGVAVFGIPASKAVLTRAFPTLEPYVESLELARLVLRESVLYNGESNFVAACHHDLRALGVRGVVSFSDPQPRYRNDGSTLTPGHVGIVYQALNFAYAGRTRPESVTLLPDGSTFHARAAAKIRAMHTGWRYAADQLEALGAAPIDRNDPARWLDQALIDLGATRVRHPGHHRYTITLDRGTRLDVERAHRFRPTSQGELFAAAGRR